jgi:RimJ/RimL family protein N-acetyltransferase
MEPFEARHLTARYVSWLNDPDVVRFSEQRHRVHTLESCGAYLASFETSPHLFWAIVAPGRDVEHIGNINAYVDAPNQIADVGILIGEKNAWGQGYGLEAWREVCRFLLDEVNLRKVTAGTLSTNAGMLSIMRRADMHEDGRRTRHYVCEGAEVDVIHMALFRN